MKKINNTKKKPVTTNRSSKHLAEVIASNPELAYLAQETNTESIKKEGLVIEDLTLKEDPNFNKRRYRMLAIGWFSIILYFFNLLNYKANFAFLQEIVGHDLAGLIVYAIGMFFGIWLLLWRGLLYITYSKFGQIDDMYDKRHLFANYPPCSDETGKAYNNINNVIDYANAKCKYATREETAKIMSNFNVLTTLGSSERGRDSLDYINCSIATMSRESGLNFIGSFSKII